MTENFYDLRIKSEILCTQYSKKKCFYHFPRYSFGTYSQDIYRPHTYEVWGKVIFSETCVSHSVDGGGGLCAWSHVHSGGLCPGRTLSAGLHPGGFCPGGLWHGGLCPWGSLSRASMSKVVYVQGCLCPGGCLSRGSLLGRPPCTETPTVRSGRYAPYWNASLFKTSPCVF